MALKATICKITIAVSDMNRHYYDTTQLTLAQHPSETTERLMARLVAWTLNANPNLEFTKGLSTADEPDLWERTPSGEITHWIELGQPDEKRLKKALSLADHVSVYGYHGRTSDQWWKAISTVVKKMNRISVININHDAISQLTDMYQRTMTINAAIQEDMIWISDDSHSIEVSTERWFPVHE